MRENPALPDRLQVGPELEIPGYGCEDHFMEHDTVEHSWVGLKCRQRGSASGGQAGLCVRGEAP